MCCVRQDMRLRLECIKANGWLARSGFENQAGALNF
jgi:hypothetical protein